MRIEYRLDNFTHGMIQATGRVHLQNDHDCAISLGIVDAAHDQLLAHRPDRTIDFNQVGFFPGTGTRSRPCILHEHGKGEAKDQTG